MKEEQPKEEKDEILELIRWIDKQKCKLFKGRYILSGWWIGLIGLIVIMALVLFLGLVISYVYLIYHVSDFNLTLAFISVSISLITLAISYFSLIGQFGQENIVRANFEKALTLRRFTSNEEILLKALIKIKAKNPKFELEELYKKDKENTLFVRKKLLEILCE